MGLLARRWEEGVRGAGDDTGWYTRDDDVDGYGRRTSSGIRVSQSVALSLTTVWRCVDLLSSTVSQAPKDIYVKVGGRSFQEFGKPEWLIQPDPTNYGLTINDHFQQVAVSLLIDGNFFTLALPSVYEPRLVKSLPPSRVNVKDGPTYEILDARGNVYATLGPDQILHGTWLRPAGAMRGISPLESLRRAIGSAVAAEDHAGRFFGQGTQLAYGIEVPGTMTPQQKKDFRESLREDYAGPSNAHRPGILTAGAKFVPGLAPTPEQAQMLATRKFSVEDLCRPYGVPPNMAGSQEPGASSFASAEIWRSEFRDYAVLPLATRIEAHYNRLVQVPDTVADPNATAQFKFNLDHVVRSDILTRYQAYKEGVLAGVLKPSEAREKEDLAPVDGSDQLFMQSQMQPVQDSAYNAVGALVRAGFDPTDTLSKLGLPAIKHNGLPPVTVQPEAA